MKDIKTRESYNSGTVSGHSSNLASKMKQGLKRSGNQINNFANDGQVTPDEYAQDNFQYLTEETIGDLTNISKSVVKKTYYGGKHAINQIRQRRRTADSIKQTAKSTGKATIKTVERNIKTVEKTAINNAVKASERTVKAAYQTVKKSEKAAKTSAKAAKKSAKNAKKAAERTAKAVKETAKAVATIVKLVYKGGKRIVLLIAAGGWVSVAIIVLVALFALIVGTGYGIFLTGEEMPNSFSLEEEISKIDMEYDYIITEIIENGDYDVLKIEGERAKWRDILAVYAVKTSGDSENPQEIVTMNAAKSSILRTVFWDMNQVEYHIETIEETIEEESEDNKENKVELVYLIVTESHKSIEKMAEEYDFSDVQIDQLRELTSEKNKEMWDKLLSDFPGE